MSHNQQTLLISAFQYAERLYMLSHLITACALIMASMLFLHLSQMVGGAQNGSAVIVVVIGVTLGELCKRWRHTHEALAMFQLSEDGGRKRWRIAPRRAGDPFYPIPRKHVARADEPADADVCYAIDLHADRFEEVRLQQQRCLEVNGCLTWHDALNLSLMATSLRGGESVGVEYSDTP